MERNLRMGEISLGDHVHPKRRKIIGLILVGSIAGVILGVVWWSNYLPMKIPHAPILIQSDVDFTSANGVISGAGLVDDPFIIAGWQIKGDSYSILVRGTVAYFRIQDCLISNSGVNSSVEAAGIMVEDAINFVLSNNRLQDCVNGIIVRNASYARVQQNIFVNCNVGVSLNEIHSPNVSIFNNTVQECMWGMMLSDLDNVSIVGNMLLGAKPRIWMLGSSARCCTSQTAISCDELFNVTFSKNYILKYNNGIQLSNAQKTSVEENIFEDNWNAVEFTYGCVNSIVKKNTFLVNYHGIDLEDSFNAIVTENYITYYTGFMYQNSPFDDLGQIFPILDKSPVNNSIFENTVIPVNGPLNTWETLSIAIISSVWAFLIFMWIWEKRRVQSLPESEIWKRRWGIIAGEIAFVVLLPLGSSFMLEDTAGVVGMLFTSLYPPIPLPVTWFEVVPLFFIPLPIFLYIRERAAYREAKKDTGKVGVKLPYRLTQYASLILSIPVVIVMTLLGVAWSWEIPNALLFFLPCWFYHGWVIREFNRRRGMGATREESFVQRKLMVIIVLEFAWAAILTGNLYCSSRLCLPGTLTQSDYFTLFSVMFLIAVPVVAFTVIISLFWWWYHKQKGNSLEGNHTNGAISNHETYEKQKGKVEQWRA